MSPSRGRFPDLDVIFHGVSTEEPRPIDPVEFKELIDWWIATAVPNSTIESFHRQGRTIEGEYWQTSIRTNATKRDLVLLVGRLVKLVRTHTVVIGSDEVRDRQVRWGMCPGDRLEDMEFDEGAVE